ncbi:MAG: hypothetical protein ACE5R6_05780 [Candidatus Heimdallarchaeota archaeon]
MPLKIEFALILEEIATFGPQIQMVALTDFTGDLKGLIKQPTTSTLPPITDADHVFLGWAIAQSYEQIGSYYAFNNLSSVTIEYKRGTVLLTPTKIGVIIVLLNPGVSVEFIRQKLLNIAEKLHKLAMERETSYELDSVESRDEFGLILTDKTNSSIKEHQSINDKKGLNRALKSFSSF